MDVTGPTSPLLGTHVCWTGVHPEGHILSPAKGLTLGNLPPPCISPDKSKYDNCESGKADSGVEEACALNQEEGVAGGLAQGSRAGTQSQPSGFGGRYSGQQEQQHVQR